MWSNRKLFHPPSFSQAKGALLKLRDMGCNTVVITLGDKGAIFAPKDDAKVAHVKPCKVDKVVDTTVT